MATGERSCSPSEVRVGRAEDRLDDRQAVDEGAEEEDVAGIQPLLPGLAAASPPMTQSAWPSRSWSS